MKLLRRRLLNLAAVASVVFVPLTVGPPVTAGATATTGGCSLNSAKGQIQHVIYIQFDNVHFTRDNPNVPSDLEQMPNLLSFIENDGVLLTNHHTPLIAHDATDIVTSLTGLYPDRTGVPIGTTYRYFTPAGTASNAVAFAYWTDPLIDLSGHPTDFNFNLLGVDGKNTPAPWAAFTRAGCNVGQVATVNTVLENVTADIPTVFGAGSAEAAEVASNPGQAIADFEGIAVHCAQASSLCSTANNGRPDLLPDEPGGYSGFMGLFGHKYVAPQIGGTGAGGAVLADLDGKTIQDASGHVGFPGFAGMSAKVSLGYVADMQEHGIPITYAYINDAHDKFLTGGAYGPGQDGYVAALKGYDAAFGHFFQRLAGDGINNRNTLFVFTADEGDHFVGGAASPDGCDGVTTPCTYSKIGEFNTNVTGLLATEQGMTTPFTLHNDSAPSFYVNGNPARDTDVSRDLERATAGLTAVNPITGNTETITAALADPVEMKILHMVTADPARTPTYTLFSDPNYFLFAGTASCSAPCITENPTFAWNHGDFRPDITTTWLGMVGPGIDNLGIDSTTWSDHADIRPTMMVLLGLKDDYAHDGRALTEDLEPWATPAATRLSGGYAQIAEMYKQIDAVVGQFGVITLTVSTEAIASGNPSDDSRYVVLETELSSLNTQRDALALQMNSLLEKAEFGGQPIIQQQAQTLVAQGQALLDQANALRV
ncbi:MAG TPA: hypothetical protein VFL67_00350 [Mycobacterium sp.]|nr:hypothetical protein [Mycobacterium sp.]